MLRALTKHSVTSARFALALLRPLASFSCRSLASLRSHLQSACVYHVCAALASTLLLRVLRSALPLPRSVLLSASSGLPCSVPCSLPCSLHLHLPCSLHCFCIAPAWALTPLASVQAFALLLLCLCPDSTLSLLLPLLCTLPTSIVSCSALLCALHFLASRLPLLLL
jgi:hypothetical protein